ncbi:hypothetical protein WJX77_002920 [Trebouxia sp. C0004]
MVCILLVVSAHLLQSQPATGLPVCSPFDQQLESFGCGQATRKGRRRKMEDRAICLHDARLPSFRFAAVYDGHEGSHAASMAAALLHLKILQQLLPCNMAHLERYTAVSAVKKADNLNLRAVPLTIDHSPDRPDEHARIVAAGGIISTPTAGSPARLQGELAVSRAIGDFSYRQFGLISQPELLWHNISAVDRWLILASDGIFESLSAEMVCHIAAGTQEGHHVSAVGTTAIPLMPVHGQEHVPAAQDPNSDSDLGAASSEAIDDPHWPNFGTSSHLATAYKGQAHYPGASDSKPEEFDLRPYVQSGTAQLMLSPGSMLQLVQRQTHNPKSCLWKQDSRSCLDEDSMLSDAPFDSTHWLSSTASALGQAVAAMSTYTSTAHAEVDSQAWFWAADSVHRPVEGLIDANASDLQPVHARAPELQGGWQKYEKGRNFARGSFGEVWRAEQAMGQQKSGSCNVGGKYILKRIFTERGPKVQLAGLREAYFGRLLQNHTAVLQACTGGDSHCASLEEPSDHIVRFVESFQSGPDLWLVFHDEGTSLHSLMYSAKAPSDQPTPTATGCKEKDAAADRQATAADQDTTAAGQDTTAASWQALGMQSGAKQQEAKHAQPKDNNVAKSRQTSQDQAEDSQWIPMMEASPWWWSLRRQPQGQEVIRDLLRQMLSALAVLQAANITHRDLKPENVLLRSTNLAAAAAGLPLSVEDLHMRLIDFGSAVDKHSIEHLYSTEGPSDDEQTAEYAPPEALLARYWTGRPVVKRTWPYDMWSLGVVWLEMLLATPHVFQISPRTAAVLQRRMQHSSQAEVVLAYFLRGLMDLCIYPPRPAQASYPQSKSQPESHEDRVEAGTAPEGQASSLTDCDQSQPHESRCRKQRHDSAPLSASCTDEAIRKVIQDRDPTHQGLPNQAAVRLLLSLLHWNPANRPTAAEALRHAFFALPLDIELTIACHTDRDLIGWC